MEKQFIISEKKILIYGAGFIGVKGKNLFEENGYPVHGFIDERADEIENLHGLPCYSLSDLKDFDSNKYCIIITVRNVFEHSLIANKLIEIGFCNLIYKPYEILRGNLSLLLQKISQAYDDIFDENIIPQTPIPVSIDLFVQKLEKPNIKYDEEGALITYVPVELLFSNSDPQKKKWSELNFASFYPNTLLFSAFNGNIDFTSSCKEYFQYSLDGAQSKGIKVSDRWRNNVLKGRFSTFNEMKYLYETDRNFFIEHCPKVEYHTNKFVLVSSGKNRVSFQTAMGMRFIPVKMEKEEYESWLNMTVLSNLERKIYNLNVEKLFAPISHPYFYKFPFEAGNYWNIWGYPVARYLSSEAYYTTLNNKYDIFNITDISLDHGNISRYLSNIGFNVKRLFIEKKEQNLENDFDDLLNCPVKSESVFQNSWAVILDTRNIQKEIIDSLGKIDMKYLCVLSWNDDIKLIPQDHYASKIKIFEAMWCEKRVQGFIYKKAEIE